MRRIRETRWTHRGQRLPALRAAGLLLLAFAVLSGIAHSGGRYFYCEALGLLPSDPCAQAAADGRGEHAVATLGERRADCCEVVTLATMPRAAQATGPTVAPAAWVAVIPARRLTAASAVAPPSRVARAGDRWRPPPRASSDARAELMVFLI